MSKITPRPSCLVFTSVFQKCTELRRKCKLQSRSVLEAQDDTATTQRPENAAAIHKGYTTGDLDAAELSVSCCSPPAILGYGAQPTMHLIPTKKYACTRMRLEGCAYDYGVTAPTSHVGKAPCATILSAHAAEPSSAAPGVPVSIHLRTRLT